MRMGEMAAALAALLAADGPALLEVSVAAQASVFPTVPAGASVSDIRLR